MNSSNLLMVLPFGLLAALALSSEIQRIVFALTHRVSQVIAAVAAVICAVLAISPGVLPASVTDKLVSFGLLKADQAMDPSFWFYEGLWFVGVSVLSVVIFSYLKDLVHVNLHLRDIEQMISTVSNRIPENRTSSTGQGALRNAVETMTEFFKR